MVRKIITCDMVRRQILDYISENKLCAGKRLPPFRTLSARYGVSVPTIQRAVAMLVSDGKLTSRVGSGTYITENVLPAGNKLVGVLMPHYDSRIGNFMGDAFISMREVFVRNGYFPVCIEPIPRLRGRARDEKEFELIIQMIERGVDGVVVCSCAGENSPLWIQLRQLPVPVICFNNCGTMSNLDFVGADNYNGGVLAARRLVAAGRVRPVIVAYCFEDSKSVAERIRGFNDTVRAAGIAEANVIINHEVTSNGDITFEDKLPDLLEGMDAVFGINDSLAVRAMNVLNKIGRRVPEDVSVIGFDDSELCELVTPRLDSINQPGESIGRAAAELLLERINGSDSEENFRHICMRVTLTSRNSVMPQTGERSGGA